jgi:hypothetical protein
VPKRDRRDAYPTLLCVLPGCRLRGFRGRAWLQLRKLRRWRDHTPDGTPTNDRGRDDGLGRPSLRTGQELFAHPALQSMGSTVRLRISRCNDRLLALSTLSRAVVRLGSSGLVICLLSIHSVHISCSCHCHRWLWISPSVLGSFYGVTADRFASLIGFLAYPSSCVPWLQRSLLVFGPFGSFSLPPGLLALLRTL